MSELQLLYMYSCQDRLGTNERKSLIKHINERRFVPTGEPATPEETGLPVDSWHYIQGVVNMVTTNPESGGFTCVVGSHRHYRMLEEQYWRAQQACNVTKVRLADATPATCFFTCIHGSPSRSRNIIMHRRVVVAAVLVTGTSLGAGWLRVCTIPYRRWWQSTVRVCSARASTSCRTWRRAIWLYGTIGSCTTTHRAPPERYVRA